MLDDNTRICNKVISCSDRKISTPPKCVDIKLHEKIDAQHIGKQDHDMICIKLFARKHISKTRDLMEAIPYAYR